MTVATTFRRQTRDGTQHATTEHPGAHGRRHFETIDTVQMGNHPNETHCFWSYQYNNAWGLTENRFITVGSIGFVGDREFYTNPDAHTVWEIGLKPQGATLWGFDETSLWIVHNVEAPVASNGAFSQGEGQRLGDNLFATYTPNNDKTIYDAQTLEGYVIAYEVDLDTDTISVVNSFAITPRLTTGTVFTAHLAAGPWGSGDMLLSGLPAGGIPTPLTMVSMNVLTGVYTVSHLPPGSVGATSWYGFNPAGVCSVNGETCWFANLGDGGFDPLRLFVWSTPFSDPTNVLTSAMVHSDPSGTGGTIFGPNQQADATGGIAALPTGFGNPFFEGDIATVVVVLIGESGPRVELREGPIGTTDPGAPWSFPARTQTPGAMADFDYEPPGYINRLSETTSTDRYYAPVVKIDLATGNVLDLIWFSQTRGQNLNSNLPPTEIWPDRWIETSPDDRPTDPGDPDYGPGVVTFGLGPVRLFRAVGGGQAQNPSTDVKADAPYIRRT